MNSDENYTERTFEGNRMTESTLTRHAAAPQAAGYLFQFARALETLNSLPIDGSVGIETLDDVAVLLGDGSIRLEQDKFTTGSSGHVYADSSFNLLNSMQTWLDACLSKEVDVENTSFKLVTNAKTTTEIVRAVSNAKTKQEAEDVLSKICDLKSGSSCYRRFIETVASPVGREMFVRLCPKIALVEENEGAFSDAVMGLRVPDTFNDCRQRMCEAILGWMVNNALETWGRKRPYIVTVKEYLAQLEAVKSDYRRERRSERAPSKVPVDPIKARALLDSVFVKQIRIIVEGKDALNLRDEAIGDYLRCIEEKCRLNKVGDVTSDDWTGFNSELYERWKRVFNRAPLLVKGDDREIGLKVFDEVLDPDYKGTLGGVKTTYSYLTTGSYHRMADDLEIGWHPSYKRLLGGGEPDGHTL